MNPREAGAYLELGKSCRGQGRWSEAEAALRKALEFAPGDVCARIELGSLYEYQDRFVEAAGEFEVAIAMEPNHAGAHCQLGRICRKQGRCSEAEAALHKALELDPRNGWAHIELGTLYRGQDRFLEAIAEFEKAIAIDGNQGWVHCQLGQSYRGQGRASEAEAALHKGLELDPVNGWARIELGALYQDQGRCAEAAVEFETAITIDGDNGWVYCQLGRIYHRQGRSSEAEAALKKALELAPGDAGAHSELGVLHEDGSRFIQAAAEFAAAAAINPNDIDAHLCIGRIHLRQGRWAEAEIEFQRAVALDRRNDRAYIGLWATYRCQRRMPEAATALTEALSIAPNSAFACTELLRRLDRYGAESGMAARDGCGAGVNDRGAPAELSDAAVEQMRARVFCLLPWTLLHIFTDGLSRPCCMWSGPPLGNARSSSIDELWNSSDMKALRLDMMSGRPAAGCRKCYETELLGFQSMRQRSNIDLARHRGRERLTAPDGTLPLLPVPFLDIRFSNVCNLRCRTCSPAQSSAWADDARALGLPVEGEAVRKSYDDWDALWRQLQLVLEDGIEEISFVGGEPLIMEEHYRILDFLIARGRTDVRLSYTTNFSTLRFQGRDVIDLWSRFHNVQVIASLDGSGRRGEYLRKGLNWDAVVANREEMRRRCPDVAFMIAPTLSIFNALHLPDFYQEWVEKGYIDSNAFALNMLVSPAMYRIQVLPATLKARALESYRRHQETFLDADGTAARDFAAAARLMEAQDCSDLLPGFLAMTRRLDQLRGEDCREVFPELAALFEAT